MTQPQLTFVDDVGYIRVGDVWLRRDAVTNWVRYTATFEETAPRTIARAGGVDWRLDADFDEFTSLMLTPRT